MVLMDALLSYLPSSLRAESHGELASVEHMSSSNDSDSSSQASSLNGSTRSSSEGTSTCTSSGGSYSSDSWHIPTLLGAIKTELEEQMSFSTSGSSHGRPEGAKFPSQPIVKSPSKVIVYSNSGKGLDSLTFDQEDFPVEDTKAKSRVTLPSQAPCDAPHEETKSVVSEESREPQTVTKPLNELPGLVVESREVVEKLTQTPSTAKSKDGSSLDKAKPILLAMQRSRSLPVRKVADITVEDTDDRSACSVDMVSRGKTDETIVAKDASSSDQHPCDHGSENWAQKQVGMSLEEVPVEVQVRTKDRFLMQ